MKETAQRNHAYEQYVVAETIARYPALVVRGKKHPESNVENVHRVIVKEESPYAIIGWPDSSDPRNSPRWLPGVDRPISFPRSEWEVVLP